MATSFPLQAFSSTILTAAHRFSAILLLLAASNVATAGGEPPLAQGDILKPYHATYRISKDGMVAEVKRVLEQVADGRWKLADSARILFFSLEEAVEVELRGRQITPAHYRYRQGPGKRKNQDIYYDWSAQVAKVELDDKTRQVPLNETYYDRLSLQLQLRLDLLAGKLESPRSYRIIDRGRIKHYRIERHGEETLQLGKRQIHAVKLRQHSPGKAKETFIWVAPDLDYLIVKIVHEDDDERYEMRLESASLASS